MGEEGSPPWSSEGLTQHEAETLGLPSSRPQPTSQPLILLLLLWLPGLLCCTTPAGLLTSLAPHFTFWKVGWKEQGRNGCWTPGALTVLLDSGPSIAPCVHTSVRSAKVSWASGCVGLGAGDSGVAEHTASPQGVRCGTGSGG